MKAGCSIPLGRRARGKRKPQMAVPRIFLVVPLLLLGMYLPAAGSHVNDPPPGALGMKHEHFAADEVHVRCGQTLTMENDSRWAHIIGPGQDGLLETDGNVPVQ